MAVSITPQNITDVNNLYVALFGRAPDGEGLGYWARELAGTETVPAKSLVAVANTMFNSVPARAYYPSSLQNVEIIESFYVKVLGRASDTTGSAYWTAALNKAGATPGSVIVDMIAAVTNWKASGLAADAVADAAGTISKNLFTNKVTVSTYAGSKNLSIAAAETALAGVTDAIGTVTTARNAIDSSSSSSGGQTFTLTTNLDSALVGSAGTTSTAGNDTFIGTDTTFTTGDQLNGGLGTDTLTLFLAGANTAVVTATDIETLSVQDRAAGNTVSLSNFTRLTTIETTNNQNNGGTAATVFSSVGATVATIRLKDSAVANAAGTTVTYLDSAISGTTNAVAVNLNNTTAAQLLTIQAATAAGGIETFNITSTGSNNTALVTLASTLQTGVTKQTVNVAGDKNVSLALTTGMTTLDASTFSGNLVADISGAANFTATGGTGDDRFVLGANLTTSDTINGGAGANTVAASTAAAFTTSLAVTNIQTLEVSTATTGGETLAMANVASARNVALSATTGGIANGQSFTVSGLITGATVTAQTDKDAAPGTLTFTLATASGTADTLNLVLNANDAATAAAITSTVLTGFEILNLTSSLATGQTAGTATHTFTGMTGVQMQTMNITGAAPVTITANTGMVNVVTIDASTATGAIVLGVAGTALIHASDAATFKTGSGNDTVSFNVAADAILTVDAGSQSSTGADTLLIYGTQATGTTKIDLSSTTDQITQINGGGNTAVKQFGFENVTSTLATTGLDITGSSGKNTITGSNAVADLIRGGAGADTITLGTTGTADTVIYDIAADVAAGTTLANVDTIANFSNTNTGVDLINIGGVTLRSGSGVTLTTTTGTTSDGTFTAAALDLDGAASDISASAALVIRDSSAGVTGAFTTQTHIDTYIAAVVANSANITTAANTKVLIAVDGATINTFALFLYDEGTLDAGIQAAEMQLIGVFTGNTFATDVVAATFI